MDNKIQSLTCIILVIALLFVIPSEERGLFLEKADTSRAFAEGEIECVIDTGSDMYSRHGLKAGFNYELLKEYASEIGCKINITTAKDGEDYLDSLSCGAIDILVRVASDSLDNPLIRKSRNVDYYCAWFLRADRNAEMKAMEGNMRACALNTVVLPCGRIRLMTCDKAPDCRTPSLTKKSKATVIMPLLLKPSSISFGVMMPKQRNTAVTVKSIMPGRITSFTKAANMPTSAKSTTRLSNVITDSF